VDLDKNEKRQIQRAEARDELRARCRLGSGGTILCSTWTAGVVIVQAAPIPPHVPKACHDLAFLPRGDSQSAKGSTVHLSE